MNLGTPGPGAYRIPSEFGIYESVYAPTDRQKSSMDKSARSVSRGPTNRNKANRTNLNIDVNP